MGRRLVIPALFATLALLAGCGSSSSSSSAGSSSNGSTTGGPSTAATQPTAPSKGGLKVTTTPKFAKATGPLRSGTVQIAYRNIAIAPDTVRVRVGSTIRWTNFDEVVHNVTSEGDRSKIGQQKFASKDFGQGATFKIKVNKPGVIHYECTIHPASMNGTIEVIG
jgi:plastocyanin